MKFIHLNLESLSSETDKHLISNKTKKNNKNEKYTYLFYHTVNEDETTLLNFIYKKQIKEKQINKIIIIKPTYTNPALLTPSL